MFAVLSYIHTDRGASFALRELSFYFQRCGIACSRRSVYNAQGNRQSGRYNDTIARHQVGSDVRKFETKTLGSREHFCHRLKWLLDALLRMLFESRTPNFWLIDVGFGYRLLD